MKVMQLISSTGFYGAENVVVSLVDKLRSLGVESYLGVFLNSKNPHMEIVEIAKKRNVPVKVFFCNGRFNMKTVISIRRFLKKNNIDIVHSHGYKSNFFSILGSAFSKTKIICTCHNWLNTDLKMQVYRQLDKFLMNRFPRIIAVSESLKEEIARNLISGNKVTVIKNGIDVQRFGEKTNTLGQNKVSNSDLGKKIIGVIGRLTKEKGHTVILKAFREINRKFSDTKLLIVGDGILRSVLENETKELEILEHVEFTGIRHDIPEILRDIDIFALPSFDEGMPIALLEAMAARKPIVATKVGAIPFIITHGSDGLLVKPGNVKELYEALEELLLNPQKCCILGENSYKKVQAEFSDVKMAQEYLKVYHSLF